MAAMTQTNNTPETPVVPGENTFTVDDTLPALVFNHPTCGHCGNDAQIEDGYASCETCRVQWNEFGEGATPDPNVEDSEVPCGILLEENRHFRSEYDYNGKHWSFGPMQPCILPSGHESEHLNPRTITTTPLTEGAS